jgi:hypothetical protein
MVVVRATRRLRMESGYNAQAYRLLEATYDLAEGDPRTIVTSVRVAARAGLPHTFRDFYPLARHLKGLGLIRTSSSAGVGIVGMFRITATGIRLVEAIRPS